MSKFIKENLWKIELGIGIIIVIIQTVIQISSFSWSSEIKTFSSIFSAISLVFLYVFIILFVEINILKENITELKR